MYMPICLKRLDTYFKALFVPTYQILCIQTYFFWVDKVAHALFAYDLTYD